MVTVTATNVNMIEIISDNDWLSDESDLHNDSLYLICLS